MKKLATARVEYSHQLHYLQMVTEKLAKAMLTPVGSLDPAPTSHTAFVRMLQSLKGRPEVRHQLGFTDTALFRSYIDSLLGIADQIQRLSPDRAGLKQPNPEYPWQSPGTTDVITPAEYDFPEFNPRSAKMIKVDRLIDDMLRIA